MTPDISSDIHTCIETYGYERRSCKLNKSRKFIVINHCLMCPPTFPYILQQILICVSFENRISLLCAMIILDMKVEFFVWIGWKKCQTSNYPKKPKTTFYMASGSKPGEKNMIMCVVVFQWVCVPRFLFCFHCQDPKTSRDSFSLQMVQSVKDAKLKSLWYFSLQNNFFLYNGERQNAPSDLLTTKPGKTVKTQDTSKDDIYSNVESHKHFWWERSGSQKGEGTWLK